MIRLISTLKDIPLVGSEQGICITRVRKDPNQPIEEDQFIIIGIGEMCVLEGWEDLYSYYGPENADVLNEAKQGWDEFETALDI